MSDRLAAGEPSVEYRSDGFIDPATCADPHPFYAAARRQAAVVPGLFGPQVVRRAAVGQVLHDPATFSSAMEAVDLGQSVPLIPLQVDPPRHRTFRRLLDPIFAPKRVAVVEPDVVAMVDQLIDGFAGRGSCDLSTELAVPLPSSVFLRLLGLPLADLDDFLAMKDGIIRPSGDDLEAMQVHQRASARRIETYFADALADRRRRPHDDLLGMLAEAEVEGERLTDEEILGICFLFILAGLDTVTVSLELFFAHLARHPERRRLVATDPSVIPTAVEELLRYETPVVAVPRVATRHVVVDGCPIEAGAHVGVCIAAANTDDGRYGAGTDDGRHGAGTDEGPSGASGGPAGATGHGARGGLPGDDDGGADGEGPDPTAGEVDLRRSPNRHLAFGGGIHRCLGSHLARVELRATLRAWHARIPEYELAPGAELVYGAGLRQIEHLPLVFPATSPRGASQ